MLPDDGVTIHHADIDLISVREVADVETVVAVVRGCHRGILTIDSHGVAAADAGGPVGGVGGRGEGSNSGSTGLDRFCRKRRHRHREYHRQSHNGGDDRVFLITHNLKHHPFKMYETQATPLINYYTPFFGNIAIMICVYINIWLGAV